jgi:cytochrome c oxidase subunit 2
MPITVKVVSQEVYDAWLAASEEAGTYVDPSQLNG